jgi:hypothetical protein
MIQRKNKQNKINLFQSHSFIARTMWTKNSSSNIGLAPEMTAGTAAVQCGSLVTPAAKQRENKNIYKSLGREDGEGRWREKDGEAAVRTKETKGAARGRDKTCVQIAKY